MKNAHKLLTADWVGAVSCAAFGVHLAEGVLASQRITVMPLAKTDQTTPNGP